MYYICYMIYDVSIRDFYCIVYNISIFRVQKLLGAVPGAMILWIG